MVQLTYDELRLNRKTQPPAADRRRRKFPLGEEFPDCRSRKPRNRRGMTYGHGDRLRANRLFVQQAGCAPLQS